MSYPQSPLSAEASALVNVSEIRKMLNEYVKNMAHTVDDDWHDSHEENKHGEGAPHAPSH